MHPVIEEICRAKGPDDIKDSALRRWQQELRSTIQPMLDELAALKADDLPNFVDNGDGTVELPPVRRGPGRPRKVVA